MTYDPRVALFLLSDACSPDICQDAEATLLAATESAQISANDLAQCVQKMRAAADESGLDSVIVPLIQEKKPIAFADDSRQKVALDESSTSYRRSITSAYASLSVESLLDLLVVFDRANVPEILAQPFATLAFGALNPKPENERRQAIHMETDDDMSPEIVLIRQIERLRTAAAVPHASGGLHVAPPLTAEAAAEQDGEFAWPGAVPVGGGGIDDDSVLLQVE